MSLWVHGGNKGEREKGVCICMRVYIGVGGTKVWVIAKISIALGLGGGGVYIYESIYRGWWNENVGDS